MIDYNIFINPDTEVGKLPCFVTSGRRVKGDDGVPSLSMDLQYIKVSDFSKYEPFSKGKALIPTIKKIK